MAVDTKGFLTLPPTRQAEYLQDNNFIRFSQKEKIEFLKTILREELSPGTTVCALSLLNDLNYPDRYFFQKFIYHRDSSVAAIARQVLNEINRENNNRLAVVDMLREGQSSDRIMLVEYFLAQGGKLNEEVLLDFLRINDLKVTEIIVRKVTPEHELDESLLSAAITRGAAWYVRAALVEILGNRKSLHLFDCIDFLMKDNNVEVKLKLIDAILKVRMEKGRVYLQQLTQDSIIWVRKKAHGALARYCE